MEDISVEDLLREREQMEQQMKKLEESAVQVIMEKEKTIQELVDKMNEMQNHIESDNSLQYKIAEMEESFQHSLFSKDDEISQLKEMVHNLHSKMEHDQAQMEERLIRLEQDTTDRLLEQFGYQMNEAKELEQNLIQRLAESDEKLKFMERQMQEQEHHMQMQQDQVSRDTQDQDALLHDHKVKLKAALQTILKMEKTVEDVYKQMSQLKKERTNEILKVTKVRDEVIRNNIKLEKECHRIQEQYNQAHHYSEQLEKEIKHLKDKIWIDQKLSHEKLIEQDRKFQFTKNQLQGEIEKLNEQINDLHESRRKDSAHEHHVEVHQVAEAQIDKVSEGNLEDEIQKQEGKSFLQDNMFTYQSTLEENSEQDANGRLNSPKVQSLKKESREKVLSDQSPNFEESKDENETLRDLIMSLKQEVEDAKNTIQTHENTIEVLQNELKNNLRSSGHHECYQKEKKLIQDLEQFKGHAFKLETHFITAKQQWAEEQNFLKEELKLAENFLLESKTLLAQTIIEREYFQSQHRLIQNQIKKQKTKKIMASNADSIKETDYNQELEHIEMVNRAMILQQQQKEEEKNKKSSGFLLSFFRR